jgi:hypothetical protein
VLPAATLRSARHGQGNEMRRGEGEEPDLLRVGSLRTAVTACWRQRQRWLCLCLTACAVVLLVSDSVHSVVRQSKQASTVATGVLRKWVAGLLQVSINQSITQSNQPINESGLGRVSEQRAIERRVESEHTPRDRVSQAKPASLGSASSLLSLISHTHPLSRLVLFLLAIFYDPSLPLSPPTPFVLDAFCLCLQFPLSQSSSVHAKRHLPGPFTETLRRP